MDVGNWAGAVKLERLPGAFVHAAAAAVALDAADNKVPEELEVAAAPTKTAVETRSAAIASERRLRGSMTPRPARTADLILDCETAPLGESQWTRGGGEEEAPRGKSPVYVVALLLLVRQFCIVATASRLRPSTRGQLEWREAPLGGPKRPGDTWNVKTEQPAFSMTVK